MGNLSVNFINNSTTSLSVTDNSSGFMSLYRHGLSVQLKGNLIFPSALKKYGLPPSFTTTLKNPSLKCLNDWVNASNLLILGMLTKDNHVVVALCRRNTKTHVEKVAGITADKERETLASMPSCSNAVG